MLIVDMPMPKSCWDCPLSEQIEDWDDFNGSFYVAECKLQYPKVVMIDEHTRIRPDSCPIKGVLPEQHGDLIDRSLLCADLAGVILSHSGLGVDEVIARQNAVIAAERKDDENN